MAGLTDLAKKYGHPVGAGQSIISFTGKSGLTPLIEVPDYAISNVQLDYKNTYHLYQRHRIAGGFGTHELMDLDAFAPLFDWQEENLPDGGVDISYLNIAIHPLLQRQNWTQRLWDHMPKYPLKGGRVGYYEAGNDEVWNAMEPSLRLASIFLENNRSQLWWQTLFHGTPVPIDNHDLPPRWHDEGLHRIIPPQSRWDIDEGEVGRSFDNFTQNTKIKFYLGSGFAEFTTGKQDHIGGEPGFNCGQTDSHTIITHDNVAIFIAIEYVEPLLKTDVTAAERKLDIFRLAVTLLHELCHAIWKGLHGKAWEPYYNDECMVELGFSMETAVFGGEAVFLTDRDTYIEKGSGFSAAAIYQNAFFNFTRIGNSPHPPNGDLGADFDYQTWWPIPVSYFDDIWHPSFWYLARVHGSAATQMGPKTLGRRHDQDGDQQQVVDQSAGGTFLESPLIIAANIDPDRQAAVNLEIRRHNRATRIMAALRQQDAYRQAQQFNYFPPQPFHNPNYPGANWRGINAQPVEPVPLTTVPHCPRFAEITNYLLQNRGEGQLCLDTMNFAIPEWTLFRYIDTYNGNQGNGFQLTPQEWRVFIDTCSLAPFPRFLRLDAARNPPDRGTGMLRWVEPPPPPVNDQCPWQFIHTDNDYLNFRQACISHRSWNQQFPADVDFQALLIGVNQILQSAINGGIRGVELFNGAMLASCINQEHYFGGQLWRWGPNGLTRRRLDTWRAAADALEAQMTPLDLARAQHAARFPPSPAFPAPVAGSFPAPITPQNQQSLLAPIPGRPRPPRFF